MVVGGTLKVMGEYCIFGAGKAEGYGGGGQRLIIRRCFVILSVPRDAEHNFCASPQTERPGLKNA